MGILATVAVILGVAWYLATTMPAVFWLLVVPIVIVALISFVVWVKSHL